MPLHLSPPNRCAALFPHAGPPFHHRFFLPGLRRDSGQHGLQISRQYANRSGHSGGGRSRVLHLEVDFASMTYSRSSAISPYMEWAKLHSAARFNLATSGMVNLPLAELGVTIGQLEINGPSIYGYEPLLQAIARRYRVPQESVVSAVGTSLANYLALAATTEPG